MKSNTLMLFMLSWHVIWQLTACLPLVQREDYNQTRRGRSVPAGWIQKKRADPGEILDVHIGIVQRRFEEIERHLLQVSDPDHGRYGQHLTVNEIQELVRPERETIERIDSWLASLGLLYVPSRRQSPAGDWLYLSLSVAQMEKMLDTEYYVFEHEEDGRTAVRCLNWSLPTHLDADIELIEPTYTFLRPRPQAKWLYGAPPPNWEIEGRMPTIEELIEEDLLDRETLHIPNEKEMPRQPSVKDACNRLGISPLCLRILYGTFDYTVQEPQKNKIAIANFLGEVNNRSDIRIFLERYRPEAAKANAENDFIVNLVAGGDDQQTPDTSEQFAEQKGYEGALDAEYVIGMTWPMALITYNVGSKPPFRPLPFIYETQKNTNEPYLAWLQYMQTQEELPSVISISYAENEQTIPPEYARRVCAEFAKLGARGVSILVASGDNGVGNASSCWNEEMTQKRFAPEFPASCPFVTSVGATRFFNPEVVAFDGRSDFSSGGGFSNYFELPVYQKWAVEGYLKKFGDKYKGLYNPQGRGIPDISAMGYHFSTIWNGDTYVPDGTSASAPTVASIIALVNDALIADGRPPLGFLNPWIYSKAYTAFTDITNGSNLGCNTSGFAALTGWDAATGFGTPWFPELKRLAMASRSRPMLPWYYLGMQSS